MLLYSFQTQEYKKILENSKGIVFFSTPHRGSTLTKYGDTLNFMVRGTHAMKELRPDSIRLTELNSLFPVIAPTVATLSFGENAKSCFGSKYACIQVVSDDSANPGFEGPHHQFIKLDYNHREICKPINKESIQYKATLNFIKQYAYKNKNNNL